MKNREYRTASGRRRASSSNEHCGSDWFGETAEEVETRGAVEKGKAEVDTRREELAKGEEKVLIASEGC